MDTIMPDGRTATQLTTPQGLDDITSYAAGVGPSKELLVPAASTNDLNVALPTGKPAQRICCAAQWATCHVHTQPPHRLTRLPQLQIVSCLRAHR